MKKEIQKLPFETFKQIYSTVPRLCVEVVLRKEDGLLMVRRAIEPAKGMWHTPGGTVLKGETLADAVYRVAMEELGIEVRIIEMLGIIEYGVFVNHYSQDISVAFLVEKVGAGNPRTDGHADMFEVFTKLPVNMIKAQKDFYMRTLQMEVEIE